MTNILFVDDESHVLDALRRAMRSMRNDWEMRFAHSGADALAQLADRPAEVVVSDMRMPGMSGRELLDEVRRLYPGTVRFILSGHTEPSAVLQAASTAHQYLTKPCDAMVLRAGLTRVHTLKELLRDQEIAGWASGGDSLPTLPAIYQRIVALVQTPDASVSDVARVIEQDLAISTMLLKVANSAYFGAANSVKNTERAVSFLGIDNVASLVLANGVLAPSTRLSPQLDLAQLWNHSLHTAAVARALARHEGWSPGRCEDAFLTGVLHDLGHVVMATARRDAGAAPAVNPSHERLGAYVVGLWGFSSTIVEAIAFHHEPTLAADPGVALPGLLHAANALAHGSTPNPAFLAQPMIADRWPAWQACLLANPDDLAVGT